MKFINSIRQTIRLWIGAENLTTENELPEKIRVVHPSHQTPVYPPTDPGIPYVEVESIVASQEELIDKIMKAAALDEESAAHIPQLIKNFAAYVHLLPASRMEQYPGNGGLFRMGLEVGFYSLRASHGVIFASEIAEVRVKSIPRWRIATLVAGMLADTFRAVVLMRAITDDGAQWNPFTHPLATHLEQRGADRYFIKWMSDAKDNQAFNNLIVGAVVPPPMLSYLAELGPHIVGAMLEAISGAGSTPLSKTVQKVRSGLINRDVLSNPNFVGRPMLGSHLEAHIIDVMRSLVRSEKWNANQNGQPLFYGKDGLFLVIQTGWRDIYSGLMKSGFTGIPTDFEVVSEILLKAGVIVQGPNGATVFNIRIPTFEKNTFEAIKLSSGVKAFGDAYHGFDRMDVALEESIKSEMKEVEKSSAGDSELIRMSAEPKDQQTEKKAAEKNRIAKKKVEIDSSPVPEKLSEDLPPDIDDILEAMVDSTQKEGKPNLTLQKKVFGLNESKWNRYKAKFGPEVSSWIEKCIGNLSSGDLQGKEVEDAFGVPASTIDQLGIGRAIAISALVREDILWTPKGEKKKMVDVDGVQYVFFNKRFWNEVVN